MAKLLENQVKEIKLLLKTTQLTEFEIAKKFKVSDRTIRSINNGETFHDSEILYPIRKIFRQKKLSQYTINKLILDIISEIDINKLLKKYNISKFSYKNIDNGITYPNSSLKYPISKNIEYNKLNFSINFSGKIYKYTNLINGLIYIGQTKKSLQKRHLVHLRSLKDNSGNANSPFHQALKTFGEQNFKLELLEENIPDNLLNSREKYWINYYKSNQKEIGYNIYQGTDIYNIKDLDSKIIALYSNCKNMAKIARILHIGNNTVKRALYRLHLKEEKNK